jgi:hypothetical protein
MINLLIRNKWRYMQNLIKIGSHKNKELNFYHLIVVNKKNNKNKFNNNIINKYLSDNHKIFNLKMI